MRYIFHYCYGCGTILAPEKKKCDNCGFEHSSYFKTIAMDANEADAIRLSSIYGWELDELQPTFKRS